MGMRSCCIERKDLSEKETFTSDNDGEQFIRRIMTENNIKNLTFQEIYKIIFDEEFSFKRPFDKNHFIIEITLFGSICINHFYDPNPEKNSLSKIQSLLFSYIAESFSYEHSKIDMVKTFNFLLSLLRNDHESKVDFFIYLNKSKSDKEGNESKNIKYLLTQYCKFLIKDITFEISLMMFNLAFSYNYNLKNLNDLCKVATNENVEEFVNQVIFERENIGELYLSDEGLRLFLSKRSYLLNLGELRDKFLNFISK